MYSVKPGCAVSGLIADSRTMVDKARVEAQVFFTREYLLQVELMYAARILEYFDV